MSISLDESPSLDEYLTGAEIGFDRTIHSILGDFRKI